MVPVPPQAGECLICDDSTEPGGWSPSLVRISVAMLSDHERVASTDIDLPRKCKPRSSEAIEGTIDPVGDSLPVSR
jgi:hypothetical protein